MFSAEEIKEWKGYNYDFIEWGNGIILNNFDKMLADVKQDELYDAMGHYIVGRNNISIQVAQKFRTVLNPSYINEYKKKSEDEYENSTSPNPTPIHKWLEKYGNSENEKYFPALIEFMTFYSVNIRYKGRNIYESLFDIMTHKKDKSRTTSDLHKQLENNNLTIQELSRLAFDYMSTARYLGDEEYKLFKSQLIRLEKITGMKQYLRNVVCGIDSYHNALYEFIDKNIFNIERIESGFQKYHDLFNLEELSSNGLTIRNIRNIAHMLNKYNEDKENKEYE